MLNSTRLTCLTVALAMLAAPLAVEAQQVPPAQQGIPPLGGPPPDAQQAPPAKLRPPCRKARSTSCWRHRALSRPADFANTHGIDLSA